jgi:hypothetical protein
MKIEEVTMSPNLLDHIYSSNQKIEIPLGPNIVKTIKLR